MPGSPAKCSGSLSELGGSSGRGGKWPRGADGMRLGAVIGVPGIAAQNEPSEASFLWRRQLAPGPRRAAGPGDTCHPSVRLPGPSTLVLPLGTHVTVPLGSPPFTVHLRRVSPAPKGSRRLSDGFGSLHATWPLTVNDAQRVGGKSSSKRNPFNFNPGFPQPIWSGTPSHLGADRVGSAVHVVLPPAC